MENLKQYRVHLKTFSMSASYSPVVTTYANDEDHAVEKAIDKLLRGVFSDYSRSMFRVVKVERVYS